MSTVRIPWRAWYGDEKLELSFPDAWRLTVAEMKGGREIDEAGIRQALANPLGSPRLSEIARGRRSAAILIDDLSRPTPAYRLLPLILEELAAGGISEDRVRIIAAVAAHRPMTRDDFIKKIGRDLLERLQVINHNAYENLDFLGHSSRGVPIFVNRDFMACEVRVALGMITPRGSFFGGGSKLLIPGACGHATIMANHRYIRDGFRDHLDEVARMAGLQFIVNPLLGTDLEIIGLVAGDPVVAFERGVELGRDLYGTPVPEDVDIGVFNAFPKDTELLQAPLALVPLWSSKRPFLKEDATVVIISASPEGLGWHTVLGPGTQLAGRPSRATRWRTILFSPNVNRWDVQAKFGPETIFCQTWPEVVGTLRQAHGERAHVAVFPAGALQTARE